MKQLFRLAVGLAAAICFANAAQEGVSPQPSQVRNVLSRDAGQESLRTKVSKERVHRVEAAAAYAEGMRLEQEGKFEKALESYQRAFRADPTHEQTHLRMAAVLIQLERYQRAIELLRPLTQKQPSPESKGLLAWAHMRLDERKQARRLVDEALQMIGKDTSEDASYYLRLGELVGRVLLELDPPSPAQLSKKLLPIVERAAKFETKDPKLQFRVGEMALHAGDPDKAVSYYERAYLLEPDYPTLRERLALALLSEHEEERAIKILEEIVSHEPERKNIYPILGEMHERMGHLDASEANYEMAVRLGEPEANAYVRLAFVQIRKKQPLKAVETLKEAKSKFPTIPHLEIALNLAFRACGQYEDALREMAAAEQMGAAVEGFLNSNFYFEYGATHEEAGHFEEAQSLMRKAIAKDANNHTAMNYLAYMWAERGLHLDEAECLLIRALELDPDNPAYQDSMGWIYYQRGEYTKALEWIQKSSFSMGSDPVVMEHLGDVYNRMGLFQQALTFWREAFEQSSHPMRLEQKIHEAQKSLRLHPFTEE